jgi:hypothetical protein
VKFDQNTQKSKIPTKYGQRRLLKKLQHQVKKDHHNQIKTIELTSLSSSGIQQRRRLQKIPLVEKSSAQTIQASRRLVDADNIEASFEAELSKDPNSIPILVQYARYLFTVAKYVSCSSQKSHILHFSSSSQISDAIPKPPFALQCEQV